MINKNDQVSNFISLKNSFWLFLKILGSIKYYMLYYYPGIFKIKFLSYNDLMKKKNGNWHFFFRMMVVSFLFLILAGHSCYGDSLEIGSPFIQNYSPADYDASGQNWAIVQDQRGILYVGNEMGLLIFDSENWRFIKLPNESRVRSLAIDKQGRIFVGGVRELGFLSITSKGELSYTSLIKMIPIHSLRFDDVWRIHATSHGIYFVTRDKIFHWFKEEMKVIDIKVQLFSFLFKDQVILKTRQGPLVSIYAGIINELPGSRSLSADLTPRTVMVPFGEEQVLIGSNNGFFIYDFSTSIGQGKMDYPSNSTQRLFKFPTELEQILCKNNLNLYTAAALADGTYAYAGDNFPGVVIFNRQGKIIRLINTKNDLQNDIIETMCPDSFGNLWLGLDLGISYIHLSSPISFFKKKQGIDSAICFKRYKGKIYIGETNGISFLEDSRPLSVRQFIKLKNTESNCFNLFDGGNFLLGGGINQILSIEGTRAIEVSNLYALSFEKMVRFPDRIFVGTISGLVSVLFRENISSSPRVKILHEYPFPDIKDKILHMFRDRDDNLWIAPEQNGIFQIYYWGDDISNYIIRHYGLKDGLPSLHKIRLNGMDGQLIVGTPKGIYCAVPQKRGKKGEPIYSFIPEPTYGKVYNSLKIPVYYLTKDRWDTIWCSTDAGICKLHKTKTGNYMYELSPYKILRSIGRLSVDEDGTLWRSSEAGLFRIDPLIKKNYHQSFSVHIRKIMVGRDLFYDGNLPFGISTIPAAAFPYQKNSLSFEYAASFFEHPQNNLYCFWLEHFDPDWSDWSQLKTKEYTNLPENHYTFHVKTLNAFETESSEEIFHFRILPPWQRTWVAYFGYFILFLLSLYTSVKLYYQRLINAKKKLEKIVSERTAEVIQQKGELEAAYGDLYNSNRQLIETRNALWGEMELAKKIQTVLIPQNPQIPGYEVSAYMKPADEVGGDYYDVINIISAEHEFPIHWVVIGDVSGHGVPAGLVMMMVQTSIHTVLDQHPDLSPEKILESVNRVIHANLMKMGENKYMTIIMMSCHSDGTIYFSGLHQDIMIYRFHSENIELIETKGMWIGFLNDIHGMMAVDQFSIQVGDIMLLYTDGIIESVDQQGQMYSEEQLAKVFKEAAAGSVDEVKIKILDSLKEYQCHDDITFMVIKKTG
jgi:serine phosphatase RsbU (regulator of sigma subunit)/ligand-binding sensor domain-containing protein